MKKENKTYR